MPVVSFTPIFVLGELFAVRTTITLYTVKLCKPIHARRNCCSRHICRYSASDPVENKPHEVAQLQPDDGEDEKRTNNVPANYSLIADKDTNEIGASQYLQQTKRSSILIHAKSRRLKYQVSDEDETLSNETHI